MCRASATTTLDDGRARAGRSSDTARVYLAYGLRLRSSIPLPGPTVGGLEADVDLRTGPVAHPFGAVTSDDYCFRVTGDEVVILSGGVAVGLLRAGREALVEPVPGVDGPLLESFLLGPVFAFLLHQRGLLALHASAVRVRSDAVAFLGSPGAGKSTAAAALHTRGHPVLADDLVAVHTGAAQPLTYPGFPFLRLCRDAWDHYAGRTVPWNPLPEDDKSVWSLPNDPSPGPLSLRRVYVLENGEREAVNPMRAAEAAVVLARHTFAGRRDPAAARTHLEQCRALAASGVMRRLYRRQSDLAADAIAQLVEDDLARD